jgi:hypothetical protein
MFYWCAFLFFLGILAFLDTIFNYGNIFRQINSVLFMLISLALLIRTTSKMKERTQEKYKEQIENLEMDLKALKADKEKMHSPADY